MDLDDKDQVSKSSELLLSVLIAVVTALMMSSSMGPAVVKPLLLDGSLISNAFILELSFAYLSISILYYIST